MKEFSFLFPSKMSKNAIVFCTEKQKERTKWANKKICRLKSSCIAKQNYYQNGRGESAVGVIANIVERTLPMKEPLLLSKSLFIAFSLFLSIYTKERPGKKKTFPPLSVMTRAPSSEVPSLHCPLPQKKNLLVQKIEKTLLNFVSCLRFSW